MSIQRIIKNVYSKTVISPGEYSREFYRSLLFMNIFRLRIFLFILFLISIIFFFINVFRFGISSFNLLEFNYVTVDTFLTLLSLLLFAVCQLNFPVSVRDIRTFHGVFFNVSVYVVFIWCSVDAVFEHMATNGISSMIIGALCLAVGVYVNGYVLIFTYISGFTVYFALSIPMEPGDAHIFQNLMTFSGLAILSWLVSRILMASYLSHFFILKKVSRMNETLAREVFERKRAEVNLRLAYDKVDEKVKRQTDDLVKANTELTSEIEERKQTERALAKSEKRYRTLVEKMHEGLGVSDKDGLVTYVNDRLCEIMEYPRSKIVGSYVTEYIDSENMATFNRQLSSRKLGIRASYEMIWTGNNNKKIFTITSTEPILDEDGNYSGSFAVFTDITDMKHMETALRKSEENLRALLNAITDSILLINYDGTVLSLNQKAAETLGSTVENVTGKKIYGFLDSEAAVKWDYNRKRFLDRSGPVRFEEKIVGRLYDFSIYPLLNANGEIDRGAVYARDITELKSAEDHIHTLTQELIKAQESERKRIARDLHDDIAQDLASLKIIFETLFDNNNDISDNLRSKMDKAAVIMKRTITSVREMAYDLRPPILDELGLVKTVYQYCNDFYQRTGIEVSFQSAGMDGLELDFDTEINLYRLIQEALNNVSKHADADQVSVKIVSSHPNILVRISDNGKGFDTQKRMLEAACEKRMGLKSMNERVGILSGDFRVHSRPDEGTRIIVEVPIKRKEPAVMAAHRL